MKRALITGASSGFGKEFAYQLAALGYDLFLVARRKAELEKIQSEIVQKYSVDVKISKKDLLLKEDIQTLIKEVGVCELLVNCAGFGFMSDFQDNFDEKEEDMIQLNIRALHLLNKKIGKEMIKAGSGGIINVSSISGFQPVPYFSLYAATKAFVLNYSIGINQELKNHSIHVMALCPGFAETGFYTTEEIKNLKRKTYNIPIFMDIKTIVKKALHAYFRKKVVYVPGIANKIVISSNKFLPRNLKVLLIGKIFKYLKPD